MQDGFRQFRELLSPHLLRWGEMDLRVLAYNGSTGFQNLLTHVMFRFRDEGSPPVVRIEISKQFSAFAESRSVDRVDELLTELERGSFVVAETRISLAGDRQYHFNVRRVRAGESLRDKVVDLPVFLLEGSGPSFSQVIGNASMNDVVWDLRSTVPPYESTDDFRENFLGLSPLSWGGGLGDGAQVIVSAPLGIWLGEDSNVSEGNVEAHIRVTGGAPAAPVRMGVVALGGGRILLRDQVAVADSSWTWSGNGVEAKIKRAIPGISRASLMVSVGEEMVLIRRVTDRATERRHSRLALHGQLDQDLSGLARSLMGEGRESARDFEAGVAILLHISGFATAQYGRGIATTSDTPDVVAFHPSRPIVVVAECTLRDIDSQSKLSKLFERVHRLRDVLGDSSVVPVIFTVLPRERIADADLDKAARSGIHVLCREDITRLVTAVVEGASPDRVMDEIVRR